MKKLEQFVPQKNNQNSCKNLQKSIKYNPKHPKSQKSPALKTWDPENSATLEAHGQRHRAEPSFGFPNSTRW